MRRGPPKSTRTDTLCPYTTLYRSPLEMVTAEPTGDGEALADEIEAGHLLCREGLGGERGGVDAAGGHLGGAESFCTAGPQAPAVQQPGYRAQLLVGEIGETAAKPRLFAQQAGAAARQPLGQQPVEPLIGLRSLCP